MLQYINPAMVLQTLGTALHSAKLVTTTAAIMWTTWSTPFSKAWSSLPGRMGVREGDGPLFWTHGDRSCRRFREEMSAKCSFRISRWVRLFVNYCPHNPVNFCKFPHNVGRPRERSRVYLVSLSVIYILLLSLQTCMEYREALDRYSGIRLYINKLWMQPSKALLIVG